MLYFVSGVNAFLNKKCGYVRILCDLKCVNIFNVLTDKTLRVILLHADFERAAHWAVINKDFSNPIGDTCLICWG